MLCVDIEDSLRLVGQYQVSLLWKLLNSISFATGVVQVEYSTMTHGYKEKSVELRRHKAFMCYIDRK